MQYIQRDTTLTDGTQDTFFEAISQVPADTVTVFRVQFSRVGQGQGAYTREGRTVNGILYIYRGPGRGEYPGAPPPPTFP